MDQADRPDGTVGGTPGAERAATSRVEVVTDGAHRETVGARLWARGALGVWEQADRLVAWFRQPTALTAADDGPDLDARLAGATWSVEADRDWQAEWKATIAPVRAGRTVVVPSWLAGEHRAGTDDLTIVLDPGRAFGSGHHATTTMCLEALDQLDLAGRLTGRTLADIGCGSGILGIAAAARGAHVTGVDIDPEAVAATGENAAANHVAIDVRPGSVDALTHRVDVVVANLVTDVIAQLAAPLVGATTDLLIASGITIERQHVAIESLRSAGLHIDRHLERDGWLAVVGHRPPRPGA